MNIPASVDWRKSVTEVRDQGESCGSCWAFAANGALEAHTFLRLGKRVSLSVQNLVDCSGSFGNNGCQGGLTESVWAYIKQNKGVDTESSYPYEGRNGKCRFNPATVGAKVTGFTKLPKGSEVDLAVAVATIGPVSVAVDANNFQFYKGGIYSDPSCTRSVNHAVLVVGYGPDYWLIKNSWGRNWGEQGFIRFRRNGNNMCGIADWASFPLV